LPGDPTPGDLTPGRPSLPAGDFGPSYLQACIDAEIPLAKAIGVVVERADDETLVLSAPRGPNANHKGTAFGGSLYCLAVLTGWAWATRYLARNGIAADAVVQESDVEFLAPVHGELRAHLITPSAADIDKFRKMLERSGRGRIPLRVELRTAAVAAAQVAAAQIVAAQAGAAHAVAVRFDGRFAAALRARSS
jgi:thioesterase domain-containing protein